ncbi:photosynthetic complex assembly protein PuhC [Elioraea sp.]|uniref:photosynthetic complex assembly protein PuhC n=1 Tax=Elioraea sp. TaxID=2185103 RepID=UPI0025BB9B28|nr:photosynthetic complex assembly protein PuhC [Elioraea sp.]
MDARHDTRTRAEGATQRRGFIRSPVTFAVAAMALVVGGVAIAQSFGVDPLRPSGTPAVTRDLHFEDTPHGAIRISDARTGQTVTDLAPGAGGFVRATLRGFARERRAADAPGPESPFRLTAWSDGRLTLEDPATGRFVDIGAFGPSQVESFTTILIAQGGIPR